MDLARELTHARDAEEYAAARLPAVDQDRLARSAAGRILLALTVGEEPRLGDVLRVCEYVIEETA